MPVLPITIQENFKSSNAERAILDRFLRSSFTTDKSKYVFHSIRAQEIGRKVVGEIDFIYLDKDCILFLEVKGGNVYFSESTREWWVMNGNKKQDPWKQVADYLFHLRDKLLNKRFPQDFFTQKLIFGYGVLFPDCKTPEGFKNSYSKNKNEKLYEYELNLVYDAVDHNKREYGIENYITRIKSYWKSHGSNIGHNGIESNGLLKIKEYFSKDIIFENPISEILIADSRSTNHLTIEQGRTLSYCLSNPTHSFVIYGGPGSGKTILALDLACKYLRAGENVLFIVYNQPLRDFLLSEKERLVKEIKIKPEEAERIKIESYYRLMTSFISAMDPSFKIDSGSNSWDRLPKLFAEKLKGKSVLKFDRLIVDECQDIANNEAFEVLGQFLKGGWESKKFTLFIDNRFQVLYSKKYDRVFFKSFINRTNTVALPLSRNCRNSENIVEEASMNTGLPTVECMKGKVFDPELHFYSDTVTMLSCVNTILTTIKKAQVKKNFIGIITDNEQIRDLLIQSIGGSSKLDINYFKDPYGKISIDTDRRYKGLDNELIIYVGSQFDTRNNEYLSRLYVSITRAKARLYILFPSRYSDDLGVFRSINGIKIYKKEL